MVEQIRSVHLTLVLVACVLLAAIVQQPKRSIERAISDAKAILAIPEKTDGMTAISVQVEETIHKMLVASGSDLQHGRDVVLRIEWPDGTQVVTLSGSLLSWDYVADAQYEGEDDIEHPGYTTIPYRVRTLADFERFWNHNFVSRIVLVPRIQQEDVLTPFRDFRSSTRTTGKATLLADAPEPSTPPLELHAGLEGDRLVFRTWPGATETVAPRLVEVRSNGTVIEERVILLGIGFGVPLRSLPDLNVQSLLIAHVGKSNEWIPGEFKTTFPDLEEHSKNIKTVELQDLIAELNQQANRDQDKIELLCAKLSTDIVLHWGLVIVAACQFYLWLHLNGLARLGGAGRKGEGLGWIGLYSDEWARLFTVASLSLPAFIAVATLFYQWSILGVWWRIIVGALAAVCAVLGGVTMMALERVRSMHKG